MKHSDKNMLLDEGSKTLYFLRVSSVLKNYAETLRVSKKNCFEMLRFLTAI